MSNNPLSMRRIAALLAVTAVLGGGVGAGLVALTGAGDDTANTTTTTTVQEPAASTGDGATATGLDASALYAATAPGVVDVTSKGVSAPASDQLPFGAPRRGTATATGTGFVIDGAGNIVTAAHVVDGASSVTVTFQDGTTRSAKVLGKDDATTSPS